MAQPTTSAYGPVRFGVFQVNLQSGELWRNGTRVKLEGQPFQILSMLLERPGTVISREELQGKLWSADTFVDFEHGINAAVKRLREALGDSADAPHFIETLPRRGYRFIYPVHIPEDDAALQAAQSGKTRHSYLIAVAAALAVIGVLGGMLAFDIGGLRNRLFSTEPIGGVVVLPFVNRTGEPAQEHLADGMTDLLTTELAQVNVLKVISVTSAMSYKGTGKKLPEITSELQVNAAVEGGITRDGDRYVITVQLISADDRHLWSRKFEHGSADSPMLRSQMIARSILGAMNAKLSPEDEKRLQRVRTANREAEEAYLQARNFWWRKFREDALWKSISFYEKAIEKDPNFAAAYSGMALVYAALRDIEPTAEILEKRRRANAKALELDPQLAEAHAILCLEQRNEAECRRALELNPNDAIAHLYYAAFLTSAGRKEESLAEARRAEQLDPYSAFISANLIFRLGSLGLYEQAVAQGRKALALDPELWLAYQWLGGAYRHLKRYEEAIQCWEKVIALQSGHEHWALPRLVVAYRIVGRNDDAQRAFHRMVELAKVKQVPAHRLALAYAGIGRKEEAIAILEKAQRAGMDLPISTSPELRELLGDDPRYKKLVAKRNERRSAKPTT